MKSKDALCSIAGIAPSLRFEVRRQFPSETSRGLPFCLPTQLGPDYNRRASKNVWSRDEKVIKWTPNALPPQFIPV